MLDHLQMLLGRLLERSEQTAVTVARIESRQLAIREDLADVKARVKALEKSSDKVGRLETWTKRLITFGTPAATLWATGSAEQAVEVFKMLSSGR